MNGYSIEIRNRDGRKKEVTYKGSVPDILSMVLDDCIRDDDTGWFFETGQGDGDMAGDAVLVKGSDGVLYGCEVISAKPVEII